MKRLQNDSGSIGVGGSSGHMGIVAPTKHDFEVQVRSSVDQAFRNGTARELKYKGVAQLPKDRALVEGFEKLPASERISIKVPGNDRFLSAGIVNDRIVVKETGQVPGLALGYFDCGIQPRN